MPFDEDKSNGGGQGPHNFGNPEHDFQNFFCISTEMVAAALGRLSDENEDPDTPSICVPCFLFHLVGHILSFLSWKLGQTNDLSDKQMRQLLLRVVSQEMDAIEHHRTLGKQK